MLARVLVIGSFLIAAVVIYALVEVAVTPASAIRGLPKPIWFVAILLFPLVGAILWFVLGKGRRRGPSGPAKPPTDIVDRPASPISSETVDDRIARLEEELRRLEDEGDVPPKDSE